MESNRPVDHHSWVGRSCPVILGASEYLENSPSRAIGPSRTPCDFSPRVVHSVERFDNVIQAYSFRLHHAHICDFGLVRCCGRTSPSHRVPAWFQKLPKLPHGIQRCLHSLADLVFPNCGRRFVGSNLTAACESRTLDHANPVLHHDDGLSGSHELDFGSHCVLAPWVRASSPTK